MLQSLVFDCVLYKLVGSRVWERVGGGHDMYVRFLKHVSLERTEIINPESVGNYTLNLKPRSPKPPNP